MSNSIIIVNQVSPLLECKSVFVNGHHVLDADNSNRVSASQVAKDLSISLSCRVQSYNLTEKDLAQYMAAKQNRSIEFNDFESSSVDESYWLKIFSQGYSKDDVIGAIRAFLGTPGEILPGIDDVDCFDPMEALMGFSADNKIAGKITVTNRFDRRVEVIPSINSEDVDCLDPMEALMGFSADNEISPWFKEENIN